MQADAEKAKFVIELVPLFFLTLPFAFGAFYLAPKIGANRWLWLVLCLIPIVNVYAICAFLFRTWGRMLDRLNALDDRSRNIAPFS